MFCLSLSISLPLHLCALCTAVLNTKKVFLKVRSSWYTFLKTWRCQESGINSHEIISDPSLLWKFSNYFFNQFYSFLTSIIALEIIWKHLKWFLNNQKRVTGYPLTPHHIENTFWEVWVFIFWNFTKLSACHIDGKGKKLHLMK